MNLPPAALYWQERYNMWADVRCWKRASLADILNKLNLDKQTLKKDNASIDGKSVYLVMECVAVQ